MRTSLLLAGALLSLAAGPALALDITDPAGDFLPTYTGPQNADLDVVFFSVEYDSGASAFNINATMAGDINANPGGLYAIGVNTGLGAIRPFADIGNPNVIFDRVIAIQKSGMGAVVGGPGGGPVMATISGASFNVVVPLALLPTSGFNPGQYEFNIWPRIALVSNADISDFAPDNATLAAVPEPATWALMIAGFGLAGGALRRRRTSQAMPA